MPPIHVALEDVGLKPAEIRARDLTSTPRCRIRAHDIIGAAGGGEHLCIRSSEPAIAVMEMLTMLINSQPSGKAGVQTMFADHGSRVHPCDETHVYGF